MTPEVWSGSVWYETYQLLLFYFDQNKYLCDSRHLDHSGGKKVRRKTKYANKSAEPALFLLFFWKAYLSSTEMVEN